MKNRKLLFLTFFIVISLCLWFINSSYPIKYLEKGFLTFLSLSITYFFFKISFEEFFIQQIKDSKTRYSFRKTVSILYIVVLAVLLLRIWVEATQTLLVSYGLIAAGLAIALQDLFKNFVGGILVFITGIYRVGDRIEIDSKYGDVIDISILYTTLLEIREWVAGEQATGRLTIISNNHVISGIIHNYTRDHSFIWDEIRIPITYDSDWKDAAKKILEIIKKETVDVTSQAEKDISRIEEKYYLSRRIIEPGIYISLTDNWITFDIRYVSDVRQRRFTRDKLSRIILDEIQKSKKIRIASTTLDITKFPDIHLKK